MRVTGPHQKAHVFQQTVQGSQWYSGLWQEDPPTRVTKTDQSWTHQLLESYNNDESHYNEWGRDTGSDFHVLKHDLEQFSSLGNDPRHFSNSDDPLRPIGDHYFGQMSLLGEVSDDSFPAVINSSKEYLRALGTVAIARAIPTNPVSQLGTAVGEFVIDGLPGGPFEAWKETTSVARSAGSSYLNQDFGWAPLVSDIRKFAFAVKNSDRILKSYIAKSGHPIKARYNFPSVIEETYEEVVPGGQKAANPFTGHLSIWNRYTGTLTRDYKSKTEQWFSGSFTYFLPDKLVHPIDRYSSLANKLLGSRLTPETLWNLAPWSWAADWFANIGDVIHNIVAFQNDGLIMEHAFMMETKTIMHRYHLRDLDLKSYGPLVLGATLTSTAKRRVAASPYGFGLLFDGFTDRQKWTIAALGLTKQGHRLGI